MMAHRLLIVLLLGALAWAAPMIARAQNCNVTVTGVAFGTYDPTSAVPRDANGSVQVECVLAQIPVEIQLDAGNNAFPAGSIGNRRMVSGAFNLPYQLYTDAARGIIWGNTPTTSVTCTTGVTSGVCTGSSTVFGIFQRATRPIYGRIPTAQDVGVGTYNDSVDVTIIF